jgi:hypothetical protein
MNIKRQLFAGESHQVVKNHCALVCKSSFTATISLCPLLAALYLSAPMRRTGELRARICKAQELIRRNRFY